MRREILLAAPFAVALAGAAAAQSAAAPASETAHIAAMAREHAHDAPVANASAQEPRQEVRTDDVVYGTVGGQPARGYMAWPTATRRGEQLPAIILVHEWWGLNNNMKMMARRLAGEGYRALAIDMYGREATTAEEARTSMQQVASNPTRGAQHMREAAAFLRGRQRAPRLGVIGWCFGGGWSLQSALFMPENVDAAVMYYGRVVTDRFTLSSLDAPLLGLFGEQDRGIAVSQVREMEAVLRELGKSVEIQVYPGAAHAFANPSGSAYNAAAAEDAWTRTTGFFARHLRGS